MIRGSIVFDLETVGLRRDSDIIAIGAIHVASGACFYEEIRPAHLPIPRHIAKLTGLRSENLRRRDKWDVAGLRFWRWVRRVLWEELSASSETASSMFSSSSPPLRMTAVLIGHNIRCFDVPVLLNATAALRQPRVTASAENPPMISFGAIRVLDTLVASRAAFPRLKSRKQASIFSHLFGKEPDAQHNALGDVRALLQIMNAPAFDLRRRLNDSAYEICEYHATELRKCAALIRYNFERRGGIAAMFSRKRDPDATPKPRRNDSSKNRGGVVASRHTWTEEEERCGLASAVYIGVRDEAALFGGELRCHMFAVDAIEGPVDIKHNGDDGRGGNDPAFVLTTPENASNARCIYPRRRVVFYLTNSSEIKQASPLRLAFEYRHNLFAPDKKARNSHNDPLDMLRCTDIYWLRDS
eukprot:gene480-868_t